MTMIYRFIGRVKSSSVSSSSSSSSNADGRACLISRVINNRETRRRSPGGLFLLLSSRGPREKSRALFRARCSPHPSRPRTDVTPTPPSVLLSTYPYLYSILHPPSITRSGRPIFVVFGAVFVRNITKSSRVPRVRCLLLLLLQSAASRTTPTTTPANIVGTTCLSFRSLRLGLFVNVTFSRAAGFFLRYFFVNSTPSVSRLLTKSTRCPSVVANSDQG